MARVTGIGGVFLKSARPAVLAARYRDRLGLPVEGESARFVANAGDTRTAECAVWSVFDETSTYFEPTTAPFMINFRVDDLDGLLAQLAGCDDVWIDPRREQHPYGRFAWVRDPDGNRIELLGASVK